MLYPVRIDFTPRGMGGYFEGMGSARMPRERLDAFLLLFNKHLNVPLRPGQGIQPTAFTADYLLEHFPLLHRGVVQNCLGAPDGLFLRLLGGHSEQGWEKELKRTSFSTTLAYKFESANILSSDVPAVDDRKRPIIEQAFRAAVRYYVPDELRPDVKIGFDWKSASGDLKINISIPV